MAQGKKTGGRTAGTPNKATEEIRTLAGAYSSETVEILIGIARNADSDAAKVAACRELLDRGHGKPRQPLTGGDAGDSPLRFGLASRLDNMLEIMVNNH